MTSVAVKSSEGFMPTVSKVLGYSPGTWYDKDTFGADGQRRFGNLVTGTGLGIAGALSVPIAQWLFPERFAKFPGQGKRLALAAILGGLAVPFAASLPAEIRAYRDSRSKGDWKVRDNIKKSNLTQYSSGFPHMKSHLARTVLEEIRSGVTTPAMATSFMQSIAQQTPQNQPWFTVGDVTRAAVGAGAGAVGGSLLGKGVSYFLGLTPKGRRNIRNVGMGLGALINTGKLGI